MLAVLIMIYPTAEGLKPPNPRKGIKTFVAALRVRAMPYWLKPPNPRKGIKTA